MQIHEPGRRTFLRSALATGAVAVAAGIVPSSRAALEEKRRFFPVKVSRDRLIRSVVGLRPYRSEGFVVRAEPLGEKMLIHNYGHGGAGVTLSWGTSSLAVDLIRSVHKTQDSVAVLGCGVIGLSTALLAQRRLRGQGAKVTIYARDLPPETTSNVAGALWLPTSSYNTQKASSKFLEQFQLACNLSNRAFQLLVGADYGVRWIENYELLTNPAAVDYELPGGAHLYPERRIHKDKKRYFGYENVKQYHTMIIEPSIYLKALLRDFYVAGGTVAVKEFRSPEELAAISEPVIFNCTGLGAKALFGDDDLIPVRGQLEILLPQLEIDYSYLAAGPYMFPRRDGIVLGGSWDHGDWSLEPDPEQTTEILNGHLEVMKGLRR